jgi:hypothetical protein
VGQYLPSLRNLRLHTNNDVGEVDCGPALKPLARLTELETLILQLGAETVFPVELWDAFRQLRYLHVSCNVSDGALRRLVDVHPMLKTLDMYGQDTTSMHGLIPSPARVLDGSAASLTELSLVNCMGLTSDALGALAGVHPLRKVAISFFDFFEDEVDFNLPALFDFAAKCPLLEELLLGEFVANPPADLTIELENLETLERGCPLLRRFLLPPSTDGITSVMEYLLRSEEGQARLPRLNSLCEVVEDEEDVEWGVDAFDLTFTRNLLGLGALE